METSYGTPDAETAETGRTKGTKRHHYKSQIRKEQKII